MERKNFTLNNNAGKEMQLIRLYLRNPRGGSNRFEPSLNYRLLKRHSKVKRRYQIFRERCAKTSTASNDWMQLYLNSQRLMSARFHIQFTQSFNICAEDSCYGERLFVSVLRPRVESHLSLIFGSNLTSLTVLK